MSADIQVQTLRTVEYLDSLEAMRQFTADRDANTPDEIWLVEHPPVFTQGLAGKKEHILSAGHISVVQTERGGQVTYHGPGQVVAYLLIDIRRRALGIRQLVNRIEQAVIAHLANNNVDATRHEGAPGVYIAPPHAAAGSKIASLGLKVTRGCTFHGVALNVAMDLTPFSQINPCGMAGLKVTDMRSLIGSVDVAAQASAFGQILAQSIDKD